MKTLEFYVTLPSGQQLLDVIEWEDGDTDIVFSEGAVYQYLKSKGEVFMYTEYVEKTKIIDNFINLLEVLALPRNEEDEVVSRVIIQL